MTPAGSEAPTTTHAPVSTAASSSSSLIGSLPSSVSSLSSWLSSPFASAASTLKSLTATNLRDMRPNTSRHQQQQRHTARDRQHDSQSPEAHQQRHHFHKGHARKGGASRPAAPGGAVAIDAERNQSRTQSRTVSRRNSFGAVVESAETTPVASLPTSVSTPVSPAPRAADAAAAPLSWHAPGSVVYPVQTSEQLSRYTAALLAASTAPVVGLPRPPPASESMPIATGAAKETYAEERTAADTLYADDADHAHDTQRRQRMRVQHAHSRAHVRSPVEIRPPLPYGSMPPAQRSRRASVDTLEDETAAAEALRLKLQRKLQLKLQPHSKVQSPDKLPTGSPSNDESPWTGAAASARADAATHALAGNGSTSADSMGSAAAIGAASAPPLRVAPPSAAASLPSAASSDALRSTLHGAVEPTPPHTRVASEPVFTGPMAPLPSAPSLPDLSSFSSANFESDLSAEEGDEDDELRLAPLLADLGIKLPFGLGGGGATKTSTTSSEASKPNHMSSKSIAQEEDATNSSSTAHADDDDEPAPAPPRNVKLINFQRVLTDPQADLSVLRQMSWNGIPSACRALSWKLLLGYVPAMASRRAGTLARRRAEYDSYLREYYFMGPPESYDDHRVHRSEADHEILKQIRQDVPRTSPAIAFFKDPPVQRSLERILFIFAVRHPASGYVQGINDIATPFYTVFAQELYGVDVLATNVSPLPESAYLALEADCFWCLSYLIDGIQDHYTFAQPGIQRMVYRLKELILRIDGNTHTTAPAAAVANTSKPTGSIGGAAHTAATTTPHIGLHEHFDRENVQFLHFSFRWMTCLLMRELKLPLILRLWDSYLSEDHSFSAGFKVMHVYVCAAFLMRWKDELKQMDFQHLIQFLQKLPTDDWTEQDVETLLAQAHVYKTLFHESPQHLA